MADRKAKTVMMLKQFQMKPCLFEFNIEKNGNWSIY